MNRYFLLGVTVVALSGLLVGCETVMAPNYVKWVVGLHVTGGGSMDQITKSYKQILGDTAVEQKGTIDAGSFAGESSGTLETRNTGHVTRDMLIVGETRSNNPLLPGYDQYGDVPVFLVEQVEVTHDATSYSKEVTNEEQQANMLHSYQTENTSYADRVTAASTFGLAGDEYIVKINSLSMLWDPNWELWQLFWKDDDLDDCCTALEMGDAYAGLKSSVEYLCRANPSKGDVWINPEGSTIYRAVAKEQVQVGGRNVDAVKLELRETSNEDSMDIANRCLTIYNDTNSAWTLAGTPVEGFDHSDTFPTVHLDPGCEGNFVHHKVGYEWWYKNVLVKAQATYYYVTVTDYGWEWLEVEGANKVLKTSHVQTAAAASARTFVEFTYTTKSIDYAVTGWEELNFDGISNAIN